MENWTEFLHKGKDCLCHKGEYGVYLAFVADEEDMAFHIFWVDPHDANHLLPLCDVHGLELLDEFATHLA